MSIGQLILHIPVSHQRKDYDGDDLRTGCENVSMHG